jgi:hypothetical protein
MDSQPAGTDVDPAATRPLTPQSNMKLELAETVAIDQSATQPLLREPVPAKKKKSKKGSAKVQTDDGTTAGEESQTNVQDDDSTTVGVEPYAVGPTVVVESEIKVPRDDGAMAGRERQPMGRVEKLRKVSSEVLDQAAYDPSMRFLLVAGFLFLLFVILLVFSKLLG